MTGQAEIRMRVLACIAAALSIGLVACSGSNTDSSTVTVAGDIPVAYAMRANTVTLNPLTGGAFAPGGDLILREKSTPNAPPHHLTALFTPGVGVANDPSRS